MHRLASIPGDRTEDDGALFVEQPPAPVVLLSSADTDLLAVSQLLEAEPTLLPAPLRALNLSALQHPAVIDHYVASSLATTRLVVVRLLGGRGHWSYGLECLRHWVGNGEGRQLLVLAGTAEEEQALACLGSLDGPLALGCAACLREGGAANLRLLLRTLAALLAGERPAPPCPTPAADPLPQDWRDDPGSRVGVILYRALWQAGDLALMEALLAALRGRGLAPRALWVSSLRDGAVQRGVADLLGREQVQAVLCGTGFASVSFEEAGLGAPLWERLGVPVLQVLCSGRSREAWQQSSIGLAPLDLSLQVALPELDGRLTTRVGAFKERSCTSDNLATALHRYEPDRERLDWIAQLTGAWTRLRLTPAPERRVALVLANYPNRNSRLANGVGLDTPASAALMLGWLAEAGYDLGTPADRPADGDALIHRLLEGRSNDPESGHRPPLDHLPLATYRAWYATLPVEGRQRLEAVWGPPDADAGLEAGGGGPGFPVRGLRFGQVLLLIQPERGYDRDPSLSYHSPDLPPTHAYLAQYLWLRQSFGAQVVVHVGKHGNLEWLPGKGLGLSQDCFPEWALGPLPHLYPFIVNDPGEGSQAKRRAQAVILDHLTPPLGRAGLHGDLQGLEALLDEYWEARQLGSARAPLLRERLGTLLEQLQLPAMAQADLEARLEAADGYLCELKEAQIRLGLHTFGTLPAPAKLAELLLCLARAPQAGQPGLTQALALDLGLDLDPWADPEEATLSAADRARLAGHAHPGGLLRHAGDGVAVLEGLALALVSDQLADAAPGAVRPQGPATERALQHLRQALLPPLLACGEAERRALLTGLAGGRIAAGPSGAPTRGRPDLLPTGRNFYSVDLRGLPTEAAWDLGRRSAELLLQLHLQEQGDDLRSLALSVWGTATMRNGGEDIGQALALMGVRPVWDGPTRRLVDVEVIPLSLLGRPRVDVTLRISGLFRDAFPQLVGWFNRATRLVAALDEDPEDNPLAASARMEGQGGRIYGSAPGAYGAGLQGLIDSGHWEGRGDLGEAFLNWSAWRYDGDPCDGANGGAIAATADRSGLERRLAQVQVVLHNQDNREHDLLDSDDYYQFQGGLSAAAERLQGQAPALWFGDHSRSERPRMHRVEREFDKVLRSRLLNPRWIEAMQGHGYKGGFEMAASLDYLFAYDASTGRVPDWGYGAISAAWLEDGAVREFLGRSNPWALRDMAERLLEAHNRGLWEGADPQRLERLRALVLESEGLVEQR
ncbi:MULTISPECIES: cobaltochelatase subunit CobN [unclassified Cyanobium]|uniref:cobaltochelatase subunit CobN n=1 Tax=unclassified Cyanobium TaxID=2627006 RepID=UPI0020CC92DD|nr:MULTISPECIES: cobaltochelatase subunit CobN [unclassified Cyanobium]MCP9833165.1 cobaltochelatase subunit CobN [Cyanobium sp. La Preciosa 7G6]MCP9935972.1 cobaltochelatase subunit CobN [Cyanobium sp. Aljojuca 7A6]